jgi:hypothetical protein
MVVKYYRTQIEPGLQSYDLRVLVESAVDMSKKVFILQKGAPPPPVDGAVQDERFVCIADPVDLEEIPEDTPDLENEMPYFRVDEVTLRFRSMDILEETKELIAADLQQLVNSLKAADNMELTEEETYA